MLRLPQSFLPATGRPRLCAGTGGWMMLFSADLPVLYHCLAKTDDLQLGTYGCTQWSRAGRQFQASAPHLGLSEAVIPGLPPRRIVYILPRVPPILSSPAEAVADPGDNSCVFSCLNSHLDHPTGHRMGLWPSSWWLFFTWSSCSAVLHSPGCTHNLNRVFSQTV